MENGLCTHWLCEDPSALSQHGFFSPTQESRIWKDAPQCGDHLYRLTAIRRYSHPLPLSKRALMTGEGQGLLAVTEPGTLVCSPWLYIH